MRFLLTHQVTTASQTWTVAKTILVQRAQTVLTLLRKMKCPAASRSSAASVRQEPRRTKERVCVSPIEDVFTVLCEASDIARSTGIRRVRKNHGSNI